MPKLKSKTSERRRTAGSLDAVVSQRREINIGSKQDCKEAAEDLRSQGNLRMLMEDYTEETWAILMGAAALEKLANEKAER